MNLRVLKKSRHIPQAGDIFVMQLPDTHYLFGRVININAKIGPMENCILIYIYNIRTVRKLPIPELTTVHILVPPMMTNRLPWTRGYFEHLTNCILTPENLLTKHCFMSSRNQYFDEYSNKLSKPSSPIGDWGLDSYRTIDDAISEALGIPLAPD